MIQIKTSNQNKEDDSITTNSDKDNGKQPNQQENQQELSSNVRPPFKLVDLNYFKSKEGAKLKDICSKIDEFLENARANAESLECLLVEKLSDDKKLENLMEVDCSLSFLEEDEYIYLLDNILNLALYEFLAGNYVNF